MEEFIGKRRDLARGRCRVVAFEDQAAGLRGGGKCDALADGRGGAVARLAAHYRDAVAA